MRSMDIKTNTIFMTMIEISAFSEDEAKQKALEQGITIVDTRYARYNRKY